jgi:hypothetical protein
LARARARRPGCPIRACAASRAILLTARCPGLQGFFLPSFHRAYWLGLSGDAPKGNFSWADPSVTPQPWQPRSYSHWGAYLTPSGGGRCSWSAAAWLLPAKLLLLHVAQPPAALPAGDFIKEPDGQPTVLALCAAANASEAWGAPPAYGWSDEPCDGTELPVMCRLQGERHGLCLLPRSALWRRRG